MTVQQVIESVAAEVFADVATIRDAVVARIPLTADRVSEIRPLVADLLLRPDQMAVGAGVIVEPALLPDQELRLEWWQLDSGGLQPLDADLNPASIGFYDYAAADWFAIPRRTGRPHVLGPYVDVHGTERYTLTLTLPITHDAQFLGVAGADVPLDRFERRVLRAASDDFVVTNAEDRVVVSTDPATPPGSLFVPTEPTALSMGWHVSRPLSA